MLAKSLAFVCSGGVAFTLKSKSGAYEGGKMEVTYKDSRS